MTKAHKITPSTQYLAPKKWVACLKQDGTMKIISGLEWASRSLAKGEATRWHMMLQRSGRA